MAAYQTTNSAYQGAGQFVYQTTAGAVVVIDTHDGERKRKRWKEQKDANERRREQIRLAIDGPDAPILVPALEALAEGGDAPLAERVQLGDLLAQVELWKAVREAAEKRARDLEDDDEEVILLL